MRIAQIAPLYESVPPTYYGGTERVVSYLTEELVRQGHEVTLFASGDSVTQARLVACCPRSLKSMRNEATRRKTSEASRSGKASSSHMSWLIRRAGTNSSEPWAGPSLSQKTGSETSSKAATPTWAPPSWRGVGGSAGSLSRI